MTPTRNAVYGVYSIEDESRLSGNWVALNKTKRQEYMREYYRRRLGITQDRYRPWGYKVVE